MKKPLYWQIEKILFICGQYLVERSKGLDHFCAKQNVELKLKDWRRCEVPNCPLVGQVHSPEELYKLEKGND
jgi:hypothetical protein